MRIAKSTEIIANNSRAGRMKGYLLISFLVPFFLLGAAFVLQGIHPFGEKQVLVTDLWHQYYPFLRLLHEKLQSGGSLLYSWESGMGTNFLSMIAYYAASPLNLLTVLVPEQFLREATALLILIKVGFAGAFFACFLKGTFRRNDFSLCIFSVMYALCSYILGYYWNIIWLDTVALLPLVVLGLVYLVRDGKYRLYVIALGLSLFTNYYIGLFTCIFAVIAYVCLCVFYLRPRDLPGRCAAMLFSSLGGGALAAVLLLPAYYALQLTYNVQNVFPTTLEFYENWRVLFSNLFSFHAPTAKEGLPNLACGMLPLVMIGPFLRSVQIRIREKVAAILVLAFLFVSCNCNILDYIWHGFHFPNMLPFRFSFLFSFVLLTLGYRAFLLVLQEKLHMIDIFAMLAVAVILYLLSSGVQEKRVAYFSIAVAVLYILILLLHFRGLLGRRLLYLALSIVLGFEMFENTQLGVQEVSTSDYASYPTMAEAVAVLNEDIANDSDDLFYRTEMSSQYSLNDPALYGYHGLSQFSSTVNVNITRWMRAMGLTASEAGNRYYYNGSTPITNLFSDIHYLISRSGAVKDTFQWEQIADASGSFAYRNRYALPLGFCVQSSFASYESEPNGNPFENQNTMFRLATGIETPLFTAVEAEDTTCIGASASSNGSYGSYSYTVDSSSDDHTLQFTYSSDTDTVLYGYVQAAESTSVLVHNDGAYVTSYSISDIPYVFSIGTCSADAPASLTVELKQDAVGGTVTLYVYQMNLDVFEEGYAMLAAGGVTLTDFSDTSLSGTFETNTDGLCYFSIPYEAGWHAQLDGEDIEIIAISDAMIAVPVTAGTHTIHLSYIPEGFIPGICLTTGSILLLAALYVIEKKRGKPFLLPVAPRTTSHDDKPSTEQLPELIGAPDDLTLPTEKTDLDHSGDKSLKEPPFEEAADR